MAILSLQNISMAFGGPLVLDNVSRQIEQGERICLVGRNGTGKSTLLNLINHKIKPDSGDIFRRPDLLVGTLSQEVPPHIQGKIFDVVSSGPKNILSKNPQSTREIRTRVEKVITRLNLTPDAEFPTLSAGMKRRVLLAKAIAEGPDLLLLDEPTNHMDIPSIELMENFLLQYRKALLFVSHDRVFLEKLATRIIEIDRGHLTSWACNYKTYLVRKRALIEAEEEHNRQFDKKISKEEIWIRKGIKARRTRDEGRVQALIKMREEKRARREQTGRVRMQAQEADRSGKLVLEAKNVTYQYDDRPMIKAFSTTILRGDKVGVMGPNGCGKTTLIRVLLKTLEPTNGHIRLGARVECAYFDQTREQLDPEKTVIENVTEGGDFLIINGKSRHAVGYLKEFLFTPDQMRSPVKTLSGGEKNRLLLARLFMRPSNFLVLDEPTNDLDAETLELLEELLLNYQGNVLLVSHDRAFLNNLVSSILVFEGDGQINEYVGGYDDWLKQRKQDKIKPQGNSEKRGLKKPERKQGTPRKLTYRENRELEDIPGLIESLEQKHSDIFERLSNPAFYKKESAEIVSAKEELESLEIEIEKAYRKWETLDALKDKFKNSDQ